MISSRKQAAFSLLATFLLALTARAHPIPDIPVRTYFPGDGTARITVEVDPRCLASDPDIEPSTLPAKLDAMSAEEKAALTRRASELVRRSVEFTLAPVGQIQPDFTYTFTGHQSGPLRNPDAVVVLTGTFTTTLAAGLTGWNIRATPEGKLAVVFQNIIRGTTHPRLAVLFPGERSYTLDLTTLDAPPPTAPTPGSIAPYGSPGDSWSTFLTYLRQGFLHVVPRGLDHILFVLGVFFLSRKWRPLLAQVTTFTLAHSITLFLATLGYVHVPGRIVEPVIAASIVFVALENIVRPRYTPWRLLVVFAFGLIHGLGFAGALNDLHLPPPSLAAGLVGFNVGVEGGQLTVIAAAFLATYWVREPSRYRRYVVIPGSIVIAAMGLWWTATRLLE